MSMSNKNDVAPRAARDRLREERAREAARSRRVRQLSVVGGVLAVLVAAVVIGILVQSSRSTGYDAAKDAPAATVGSSRLLIPVGAANASAPLMTVYEDPRCPACGEFEKAFHTTVNSLVAQKKLRIQYHVVSFIDRHTGGTGSRNAADALACAQNAGLFHDYHDVLYANQPDETASTWNDKSVLLGLAKQVPGLDTPAFRGCVNDSGFGNWVSAVQKDFDKSGFESTPTVLLNGVSAYPTYKGEDISPANFQKWVDALDKG